MTDSITKLLLQLGIRSTYYGFRYLRYALELCLLDEHYLTSVYKTLYSEVAEKFGTSLCSIVFCDFLLLGSGQPGLPDYNSWKDRQKSDRHSYIIIWKHDTAPA